MGLFNLFIGAKLFPEPNTKADHGQLLRTIGFSSAPGLIRVFGFTPELMSITFIGAGIWMLIAMVIAVRQALDYQSTWRAIGVVVIGFLVQAISFNNFIENFWTSLNRKNCFCCITRITNFISMFN